MNHVCWMEHPVMKKDLNMTIGGGRFTWKCVRSWRNYGTCCSSSTTSTSNICKRSASCFLCLFRLPCSACVSKIWILFVLRSDAFWRPERL
ncbi:unnamed protein product [Gongylonema pulchrum]|uniref:Uncharacterized protein n=1 Tax=Gongylonema pulchrum TaxID=637853 RepID=A0A3P6SL11_9BILA|nr:unnamed protein product [Gongylonema pulchrum]